MSCVFGRNVRTVPTSCACAGITLIAPGLPACIAHRLITAVSSGLTLRLTIDCTAVMMCPATSTGSTAMCGCAPWPPRPSIRISMRSAAAIAGPGVMPMRPGGSAGQLCSANTRSAGKRSNRPSSIIAFAPAWPSSPGWKIRYAMPSKLRVSLQVARRREQHRRVAVVTAAVHAAVVAGPVRERRSPPASAARPCRRASRCGVRCASLRPGMTATMPVRPTPA